MSKYVFILFSIVSFSQNREFTYDEFLGFVKKFNPMVKNANLEVSQAQANLLASRGAFDPKIEADFSQKEYKDKKYYSIFNGAFKIPTWYGIELKAGFENNQGDFLNDQNNVPNNGLVNAGINFSLLEGLLINQRMADLRKAKINVSLSQNERKLRAIEVLYEASLTYFNWKRAYDETELYKTYLKNAEIRLEAVKKLIQLGDRAEIDATEAEINVNNRKLNLEDGQLKLIKARLELSNFLWTNNGFPLELEEIMIPEKDLLKTIETTLQSNELNIANFDLNKHPKISAFQNKLDMLDIDRRLKANSLLPKVDIGYSYLSEPNGFNNYRFQDYKVGLNVSFPLFLRKERGGLRSAKLKIEATKNEFELGKLELKNKISATQNEVASISRQNNLAGELVDKNSKLLNAEERLFQIGESSLFLINTRENNLVVAQLSKINLENRFFAAHANLFRTLVNIE